MGGGEGSGVGVVEEGENGVGVGGEVDHWFILKRFAVVFHGGPAGELREKARPNGLY